MITVYSMPWTAKTTGSGSGYNIITIIGAFAIEVGIWIGGSVTGIGTIAITKIDVLNDMEFISAGTHYEYDGKETDELPFDLTTEKVNPVYHVYQGWKQDTGVESEFECLPEALKAYTMSLESLLKTPITMISTGPERERLVLRNKN
mgnify:CR=1 FL=1